MNINGSSSAAAARQRTRDGEGEAQQERGSRAGQDGNPHNPLWWILRMSAIALSAGACARARDSSTAATARSKAPVWSGRSCSCCCCCCCCCQCCCQCCCCQCCCQCCCCQCCCCQCCCCCCCCDQHDIITYLYFFAELGRQAAHSRGEQGPPQRRPHQRKARRGAQARQVRRHLRGNRVDLVTFRSRDDGRARG
jgi:hypothetical protein